MKQLLKPLLKLSGHIGILILISLVLNACSEYSNDNSSSYKALNIESDGLLVKLSDTASAKTTAGAALRKKLFAEYNLVEANHFASLLPNWFYVVPKTSIDLNTIQFKLENNPQITLAEFNAPFV